ncbi:hypothetical protein SDC9_113233 [bioreactor metagenome]|uniref:Uncharacterized protein n=1 Tax=bioreactor metagenome TaxID=1076179 RepID=A0A645BLW2_9ZZZZ
MVGEVEGDQHGFRPDRRKDCFAAEGDAAMRAARADRRVKRCVFRIRNNDLPFPRSVVDDMVVALGRAGGEENLFRQRADQLRRRAGGPADGQRRVTSVRMEAGRIAEDGSEIRQHGFDDFRLARRGGIVVQINHWLTPGKNSGCRTRWRNGPAFRSRSRNRKIRPVRAAAPRFRCGRAERYPGTWRA